MRVSGPVDDEVVAIVNDGRVTFCLFGSALIVSTIRPAGDCYRSAESVLGVRVS